MKIKNIAIQSAAFLTVAALSAPRVFGAETVDLNPSEQIGKVDASANDVVRFAINGLTVIAIIASLIWLLYGGLRWVISGGDKAKVDAARGTIVAAIVGLIIVILAWVIINAVLQILTGTTLNTFTLPSLGNSGGATPTPTP